MSIQVANGRDSAAQVRQLQLDNKHLRSQLEQQYNQIIKMAETIQKVHLTRIKDSVRDGDVSAFKVCLANAPKWWQHHPHCMMQTAMTAAGRP